jgi:hypothetical protein
MTPAPFIFHLQQQEEPEQSGCSPVRRSRRATTATIAGPDPNRIQSNMKSMISRYGRSRNLGLIVFWADIAGSGVAPSGDRSGNPAN